ncbi:MAG: response regulator [Nitrosopumilus sp.]|nr:response regulator [Nitrosopumilus sp.]
MKQKILIADDSLFLRTFLKNTLLKIGFTNIIEAKDGKEVVQLFKSEKPDIVFLDIVMLKIDGDKVLEIMIEHDPFANVILLTSIGHKNKQRSLLVCGARDYLVKPFDEKEICEILQRITNLDPATTIPLLSKSEKDSLKEVIVKILNPTATVLSQMINQPLTIRLDELQFSELGAVRKSIGKITHELGVNIGITGQINGSMLLIWPEDTVLNISQILLRNTEIIQTTEIAIDSVKEISSVMVGHCLTAFSEHLGIESTPELPRHHFSSVYDVLDDIGKIGETTKALLVKVSMLSSGESVTAYIYFIFSEHESRKIINSLKMISSEEKKLDQSP